MTKLLYVFVSTLFTSLAVYATDEMNSFLPDTSAFVELTLVQQPRIYTGNELFEMIDGGAEVYLEYGFKQALSVSYLLGQNDRIDIQLYQMTDTPAAFGVLTHSRSNKDSIIENDCRMFEGLYYTLFQKGIYYGIVSWSELERNQEIHNALVKSITDKMNNSGQLPVLAVKVLNSGYTLNQIKYIRGKIALSANYFFSHNDLFSIEEALYIEEQGTKYFIFAYSDKEKPQQQLKLIKAEFSASTKISGYAEEESQLNYTDRKNRNVSFRIAGNYLLAAVVPNNEPADWDKLLGIFN
jgi:hypothetical protein